MSDLSSLVSRTILSVEFLDDERYMEFKLDDGRTLTIRSHAHDDAWLSAALEESSR